MDTGQIIFDPHLPWSLLAIAAGLAALFTALALWRGLRGWWLRGLAAVALLIALANPALQQEERAPLSDIVLMVIDGSASQQIAEGGSSCSCRAGHRIKRLQDCLRDSQHSLPDGWGSLRMHPRRTMTSPN